ncbi:MAG: chalcone isomerase family protein [Gammaproteobacteria bacterium]|nr:chalcone isomerase family protein [Gammaproteobacteria bacterium]
MNQQTKYSITLLSRLVLGVLGVCFLTTAKSMEIPAPLQDDPSLRLQPLGNATVRWMGFAIYDAALWSANEMFDGHTYSEPVLLSITYRKNISIDQLLSATDKQWRKLDVADQVKRQRWIQDLKAIWPDVSPGDVIACFVMKNGETRFYNRTTLLGSIEDPDFGPGFLAIWLSPDSHFRNARKNLLGIEEI